MVERGPLAPRPGGGLARSVPRGRGLLRDVDRLPLQASIDLVALAWASRGLRAPTALADLAVLTERILARTASPQPAGVQTEQAPTEDTPASLAAALLEAIPSGGSLPRAALSDVRRLSLVVAQDEATLGSAVALVVSGHPGVSAHVAEALRPALALPAHRSALWREAVAALARVRASWRVWDPAGGRDTLVGALISDALQRADLDAALDAARAWPPTRTALLALVQALVRAERRGDAREVLGWYSAGSGLHEAAAQIIEGRAEG